MACIVSGVCLLMLALTACEASLYCNVSTRIPWIPVGGIDVEGPWEDYPAPESACCNETEPTAVFDAQEKCSLCYDLTHSTPGFAADPNNCQKFYICEEHDGMWTAFPRICPNCTFWDQDKLTCVQVDPSCLVSVSVATDEAVTAVEEDPSMFCINFEDGDLVSDNMGVYRPWVMNDKVTVVTNAMCIEGNKCGFFNESRLEIPFFANLYDSIPSLRITFYYKIVSGGSTDQGIISNDCNGGVSGASGNSLFCHLEQQAALSCGLSDPNVSGGGAGFNINHWIYVELSWNGKQFVVSQTLVGGATQSDGPHGFEGKLRNSHCPLVIGSFIKDRQSSYFHGYMDNICFYKW